MKKRKTTALHSGFSQRFNYLLDKAGYPEIHQGRLTALSNDENMSMAGVRKWIVEDNPPKASKLMDICERLLKEKISGKYNPKRIAGWLEYGDEVVPNPFESRKSIEKDHLIMGDIYVLVYKAAKRLGIDIHTLEPAVLNNIYKTIMDNIVKNGLEKPNSRLITSLLVIAKNNSTEFS